MKLSSKVTDTVQKFQEGGAMPPEGAPQEGAPAEEGAGQDPVMQLVQLAQQALSSKDCQAALAVCDGLLQMIQAQQGGQEGAPADPAAQGAPVYKKGGTLVRRIK